MQYRKSHSDLLIIGAGLARLITGWLSGRGMPRCGLLLRGGHHCSCQVVWDVLGVLSADNTRPVTNPAGPFPPHCRPAPSLRPGCLQKLAAALAALQTLCARPYPLRRQPGPQLAAAFAVGTFRPCLAPRNDDRR